MGCECQSLQCNVAEDLHIYVLTLLWCHNKYDDGIDSSPGADVNLADFFGKTPLYICVNNAIVHTGSCKMAVQKLVSAGAIIDK